MKKKLSKLFLSALCLSLLLVGCSTKEEETKEEPQYADDAFVQDMASGLQARWYLTDQDEQKEGYEDIPVNSEEHKDMMLSYINAELDYIGKYQNEQFEDSKLQEIAIKYINLLNQHIEICEYITVDYEKYYEEFEPIYNERSKVITELVEDYGLTVEEKYQTTLNDFLTNSQLVTETENKEKQIEELVKNIQFSMTENIGGDYKKYSATVENTTDINFSQLQLTINLLDADGVILESTYSFINNFASGQKANFEFNTDKEFVSTDVQCQYWEE